MTDKHAAESFEIGEPLIAFGVKPHKARSFERSSASLSHTVSKWAWSSSITMRSVWNIETKHGFLCINICWAPREMLKPEPERGPADLRVSEKHVRSLLLHTF